MEKKHLIIQMMNYCLWGVIEMRVLELLNEKRKELDEKYYVKGKTKRIDDYLKAVENNETEKYWDLRDVRRGRMSCDDYNKKWNIKLKRKGRPPVMRDMQTTLKNRRTLPCPKCKLSMMVALIDGDTIWYYCKTCSKIDEFFKYTVCRCGEVFPEDGYKHCAKCREIGFQILKLGVVK